MLERCMRGKCAFSTVETRSIRQLQWYDEGLQVRAVWHPEHVQPPQFSAACLMNRGFAFLGWHILPYPLGEVRGGKRRKYLTIITISATKSNSGCWGRSSRRLYSYSTTGYRSLGLAHTRHLIRPHMTFFFVAIPGPHQI